MDKNLVLYVMDGCPFCHKVERFLNERGIALSQRNISHDPEARATLKRVGGKVQVPCLFIDGEPLYESDDVIAYLDSRR